MAVYLRDAQGEFAFPDAIFPEVESPFPGLPLSPQARIAKITSEFDNHVHTALVNGVTPEAMSSMFRWAREALDFAESQPGLGRDVVSAAMDIVEITEATPGAQFRGAALYLMGLWSLFGLFGRKQDGALAMTLFMSSAESGYSRALYRIGSDFEARGDVATALTYFEHGVKRGDAACCYRLAMAYLRGHLGCNIDRHLGLRYLETSSLMSDPDSPQCAYVFGLVQLGELPDVLPLQSRDEALQRESGLMAVERAAWLGFRPAQFRMGKEWQGGLKGFDSAVALRYFHLASRQEQWGVYTGAEPATLGGGPEAEISKWFLCGSDGAFPPNEEWAYKFACIASEHDNKVAEFAVGYFFEVGIYVGQDVSQARAWYKRSAAHGCNDAIERLRDIGGDDADKPKRTLTRKDHEQSMIKRGRGSIRSTRGRNGDRDGVSRQPSTASTASTTPHKVTTDCNTLSPLPRRPPGSEWVTKDTILNEGKVVSDMDSLGARVEQLGIAQGQASPEADAQRDARAAERRQGEAKTALQLSAPRRRPGKGHKKHSSIAMTSGMVADSSFQQTRNNASARKTSIPVQMMSMASSFAQSMDLGGISTPGDTNAGDMPAPGVATPDGSIDSRGRSPASDASMKTVVPGSGTSTPVGDSVAPLVVARKVSRESLSLAPVPRASQEFPPTQELCVSRKTSQEFQNMSRKTSQEFQPMSVSRKTSQEFQPVPRKASQEFQSVPRKASQEFQVSAKASQEFQPASRKTSQEFQVSAKASQEFQLVSRKTSQEFTMAQAAEPATSPAVSPRRSSGQLRTPSPRKSLGPLVERHDETEGAVTTTAPQPAERPAEQPSPVAAQTTPSQPTSRSPSPSKYGELSLPSQERRKHNKRRSLQILPLFNLSSSGAKAAAKDEQGPAMGSRRVSDGSAPMRTPSPAKSDVSVSPGSTPPLQLRGSRDVNAPDHGSPRKRRSGIYGTLPTLDEHAPVAPSTASIHSATSQASLRSGPQGRSPSPSKPPSLHRGSAPTPNLAATPAMSTVSSMSSPAMSSDGSIFSRASTMTSGITELSESEPTSRPPTTKPAQRLPLNPEPLAKKAMTFDDMGIKIADKDEKEDCVIM